MNNFSTPIISNTKYSTNNDTSLTFSEELGLNTSANSGYGVSTTPVATLRGGGDINMNEQRSKSQPKSGRLINVNTPFKGRTGRVEQSQSSQPSYNKIRSRSKSRSKSTSKQRQPVTQNLSSTKEKFVSKLSVLHRKKKQYAVSNSADNNIKLSNGSEFNTAIAEARSQIRDNGNNSTAVYGRGGNQMRGGDDNVCDYCQSISHGKTRSEMYARLEYVYCSTQCTRSHQVSFIYVYRFRGRVRMFCVFRLINL